MVQNDPKIRQLGDYAKEHGYAMVVAFAIANDGQRYEVVTYGFNAGLCTRARAAGDQLAELVDEGQWPDFSDVESSEPPQTVEAGESQRVQPCPTCEGCGRVADDGDQTSWSLWENIPLGSSAAVAHGLVKPMTCPTCGGTGKVGGA